MPAVALRHDEKVGLGIALALHLALVAVLLLQDDHREPIPEPERVTVNLATDIGPSAAAPEPVSEARMAEAPTLSDLPPLPPVESPAPEPSAQPEPARARPRPRPKPSPQSTARPTAKPRPTPAAKPSPSRREEHRQAARPAPKPAPSPARQQSKPEPKPAASTARTGGASRIGKDFLDGVGQSSTAQDSRVPASQIGASARASLSQAIARQLKPHWRPVDGADREKLVSIISWRLNPDGSLAGKPRLVRQTGITDANRAQAARHAENAIRAVELAAPFDLPDEYYNGWKYVSAFSFDWKLSQ